MVVQLQPFQIFEEGFKYASLIASTSRNTVIRSIKPLAQIRIHTVCYRTPNIEQS